MAERSTPPSGAQLVSRAFDLLRAVSRGPDGGRRLRDLAAITGLTEPTARRILKSLIHERVVTQETASRLYRLGPLAFELGLVSNPYRGIIESCRPFLQTLAVDTGDSAFLCIRGGVDLICLSRAEGDFPIRASMIDVGGRLPLGVGALGTSLLSVLGDIEVGEILDALEPEYARFKDLDRSIVLERIDHARRDGFSNVAHQPIAGVRSIGMAISGTGQPPALGIATVAIESRLTPERVGLTVRALRACSAKMGSRLGP